MALTPTMTPGDITKLRGASHAAQQFLALCPNTVVFRARVDQLSFDTAFASLEYTAVSAGAIGDVNAGMTVFLSKTASAKDAYWRGRVRANDAGSVGDADTIFINETSTADIANNDYIIVVDDYDIHPVLAREFGIYYKDFDHTFRQLPPIISGVNAAYAGFIDRVTNVLSISFSDTSAILATQGATFSGYSWDFDDGTPASSLIATPTVTFPEGFRWISLTVSDLSGRSSTMRIPIWAFDPDDDTNWATYGMVQDFSGASINGQYRDGWNATITGFDNIANVLDRTACCIWTQEWYNGTEGSIVDNVEFVGRLRSEKDTSESNEQYSLLSSTEFEIEGPQQALARLAAPLIIMRNDLTPTVWDEISTLTSWRAIIYILLEHSTFFNRHSLSIESVGDADDNTFREITIRAQEQNLLDSVRKVAEGITGVFEMDARGRARLSRDAVYLTTAQRNSLTTVMNFDAQDASGWTVQAGIVPTIGQVNASGAAYWAEEDTVDPKLSWAPGEAQGDAPGKSTLAGQVLASSTTDGQSELNQRAGHHLAALQPVPELTATMPGQYHIFYPSRAAWYTWTLPSSVSTGRRTYTTDDRWLLESITIDHDNARGLKQTQCIFKLETEGAPGRQFRPIFPGQIELAHPAWPPFEIYGSFPEFPGWIPFDPESLDLSPYSFAYSPAAPSPPIAPKDGNTALVWTRNEVTEQGSLYLTKTLLSSAPSYTDVTPIANKEVRHALWQESSDGREVLCLIYDADTDKSIVYRTDDIFENPPDWTAGTEIDDKWDFIRYGDDGLYVFRSQAVAYGYTEIDSVSFNLVDNFFVSFTETSAAGTTYRLRFEGDGTYDNTDPSNDRSDSFYSTDDGYATVGIFGTPPTVFYQNFTFTDYPAFEPSHEYTTSDIAGNVNIWGFKFKDSDYTDNEGTLTAYLDERFEEIPAACETRYSTDRGASFGAAVSVGAPIGTEQGGGDMQLVGTKVLAGSAGAVRVATSGGAYANETNSPASGVAIKIPRYRIGGTSDNTDVAQPDYYVGANAEVTSETLWSVKAATGATAVTPDGTASGELIFNPQGLDVAFYDSNRVAVLTSKVGVITLWTSTNGGSTWSDRGAMGVGTSHVRFRKGDTSGTQLFLADEDSGVGVSSDFGANIEYKASPDVGVVKGVEVYG